MPWYNKWNMILIILGVIMLIGLVILHELGHFIAARRAGVEVEEFGIGFPPKAKTLGTKNGTEYTLNWLPLGGFVKLKGEHDSDTTKGSFGAASLRDKVKIMVAGVVVNFITAVFLLTIIASIALPQFIRNEQRELTQFYVPSDTKIVNHDVVLSVVGDSDKEKEKGLTSPAADAGLEDGDILLSLIRENCEENSTECLLEVEEASDVQGATQKFAGEAVTVRYIDNGDKQVKGTVVNFRSTEEVERSILVSKECLTEAGDNDDLKAQCPAALGYFGVYPDDYIVRQSTWSAPIVATVVSGQIVQETLKQFGGVVADLFRGDTTSASEQVTGVVGIGYILNELSSQGFVSILFLVAVISLSLAVMNILPIPALDGGRLFVTLLFRVLRKPLTKETEEKIHGTGFMMLMLLFVLITVVDVQRFIL